MSFCLQSRDGLGVVLLSLAILLALGVQAVGEERGGSSHGPLDGMAFVGKIGPANDPDLNDVLYFKDGHFWSQACTRCGFAPAPYWVRYLDDGIEFRGFLESPDRGRFSYLGFVSDGRITVAIRWRRERWYWSIDRDLRFEGSLSSTAADHMTLESAREVAGAEPSSATDCP